jgi:hypothetical protein
MNKQEYYNNKSVARAKAHGIENHFQRQERLEQLGIEIWNRGATLLEDIKSEIKTKLDQLWERSEDEPTSNFAPLRLPKEPLGPENTNFEPDYFNSFSGKVKNKLSINEDYQETSDLEENFAANS